MNPQNQAAFLVSLENPTVQVTHIQVESFFDCLLLKIMQQVQATTFKYRV